MTDHFNKLTPALAEAHESALVAAAYEEAADACADYPRVAPDATEAQHYDEQIEHSQACIRALTPADAKAALERRDAQMRAQGRKAGMREAYELCKGVRKGAETDDYGIGALDCAIAILAAAEEAGN